MTRNRVLVAVLIAVLACAVGCGSGKSERNAAVLFGVGDCVSFPAGTPSAPDVTRAAKVACSADPSYTVGAVADATGVCPSDQYQHLPAKLADPSTARLCLVPNLVTYHCYELGVPAGVMGLADCTSRGNGVLVQVTQRLDDVQDGSSCPKASGEYAWRYPSPARTYCTRTLY